MDKLIELQPNKYAPFNKSGKGNLGYLFLSNKDMFEYIINETAELQKSSISKKQVLELLNIDFVNNIEDNIDNITIKELNFDVINDNELSFEYIGRPQIKKGMVLTNKKETYPRSKQVLKNALKHANYFVK